MIICPKCNQSLPDWSQNCQFCGADTKKVARPVAPAKKTYAAFAVPKWVWICYYSIAAWWILGGALDIMNGMHLFGAPKAEPGETVGPDIVMVIGGALTALFGIGLAARIEFFRGIANFFAGLKILFAILGLIGSFMSIAIFGFLGVIFVILNLINLATAVGIIYLIGETDKEARY